MLCTAVNRTLWSLLCQILHPPTVITPTVIVTLGVMVGGWLGTGILALNFILIDVNFAPFYIRLREQSPSILFVLI